MSIRIVHWISKDARYRIIELMLSTRTAKQLASELGLSVAAINKYLSRRTHPSDETIARILGIMSDYERERVLEIIMDDLLEALETMYNEVVRDNTVFKEYFLKRVRELLEKLESTG